MVRHRTIIVHYQILHFYILSWHRSSPLINNHVNIIILRRIRTLFSLLPPIRLISFNTRSRNPRHSNRNTNTNINLITLTKSILARQQIPTMYLTNI